MGKIAHWPFSIFPWIVDVCCYVASLYNGMDIFDILVGSAYTLHTWIERGHTNRQTLFIRKFFFFRNYWYITRDIAVLLLLFWLILFSAARFPRIYVINAVISHFVCVLLAPWCIIYNMNVSWLPMAYSRLDPSFTVKCFLHVAYQGEYN